MGRAKKLKQLRKAARTLPPDFEKVVIGEKVHGHELIKERDMYELPNGEKVDPHKVYRETKPQVQKVDHYRKMKGMLRPGKQGGILQYAAMVEAKHAIRLEELAKEEKQ
jgi:hypothetical protein